MVKKIEDIFICFDTMHERDRQTHTHTLHDSIGRVYAQHHAAKSSDLSFITDRYGLERPAKIQCCQLPVNF